MSLPPGFLDELRTRTSLAQVVGRKVTWDMKKSQQGKGDMWAPCPFHQEKTASFHVDDKKGYYYCFGCHAKGDAISFVRETENVGFMDAIEILAREAGLQMPARDPEAQQKADRRTELSQVLEQAVQYFRLQLKTAHGTTAREYLDRRGLREAAQGRWDIGFAPDTRHGLLNHFKDKGVAEELVVAAGLAIKPDSDDARFPRDGGAAYDRFRGRIIFPIRDARGRAISLGGRALDPNARAKYLNGPETELFDKGRSLFNLKNAREAAGKAPLVVAEGYMDVIALSEAGFQATVAPLGTAITDDQLRLMWRLHPEPIIALDGDTAGLRAAMRVIDLALPLIEAGQSLRFAIMPEGLDPDDLIKQQGAAAMQKALDAALPMVQLLWRRETEGKVFDSPERKAALDRDLRDTIRRIADPSLRSHYGQEINRLRRDLFDPRPAQGGRGGFRTPWRKGPPPALAETRSSLLAAASGQVEEALREAVILATFIVHPRLVERFESQLERIEMVTDDHRALQHLLLAYAHDHDHEVDLRTRIDAEAGPHLIDKLFALNHVTIAASVRRPDDGELATLCLTEEMAKLEAARGARREVEEAMGEIEGVSDEGLTWRLGEAARARENARRGGAGEDKATYDRADNGVLIAREEKDQLEALLRDIDYAKGGRKSE